MRFRVKVSVKSGIFGHQVNSDTHLQTVDIQMRRLLISRLIRIFTVFSVNLFFIPIVEVWNKQDSCPSLAVCPNIPDFTLINLESVTYQFLSAGVWTLLIISFVRNHIKQRLSFRYTRKRKDFHTGLFEKKQWFGCKQITNKQLSTFMCRDLRFPAMWYVRTAKALTSLRIRAVWSEHLLVNWRSYEC